MSRPLPNIAAQNRSARQGQITQGVQHLVAHGLIGVAEPTGAEHIIAIHNNRVVQRAAKRQTVLAHRLHIRPTAECAAVTQLTGKSAVGHIQRFGLVANRAIFKINREFDCQTVRRQQCRPRPVFFNCNRLQHFDGPHRRVLPLNAAGHDAPHKRRRRAIQDRNLGAINFNQCVMHTTSGQGRHHMFDSRHRHARTVDQTSAERAALNHVPAGRNHCIPQRDIGAPEPDAMLRRGGTQHHPDGGT